jgi:hypothetical protein
MEGRLQRPSTSHLPISRIDTQFVPIIQTKSIISNPALLGPAWTFEAILFSIHHFVKSGAKIYHLEYQGVIKLFEVERSMKKTLANEDKCRLSKDMDFLFRPHTRHDFGIGTAEYVWQLSPPNLII